MTAELTLGAEEELHLIDRTTRTLSASAPQLLSRLPGESFSAELQRTTVETNTSVVTGLAALREELVSLRKQLIAVADPEGIGIAAVGTAPRSSYDEDFELTANGRFGRMQQQYRLLVDEQLICGTQIHVGVSDRDLAIDIAQRIGRDLPTLLALSASSPYWNGQDTGYASIRTILWQRWPTTGALPPLGSAKEYDALLEDLVAAGVIADGKMAYFDVRPRRTSHARAARDRRAARPSTTPSSMAGLFRAMVRSAASPSSRASRTCRWRRRCSARPPGRRRGPGCRARCSTRARRRASPPRCGPRAAGASAPCARGPRRLDEVSELAARTLAQGTAADRQRAAYAAAAHSTT